MWKERMKLVEIVTNGQRNEEPEKWTITFNEWRSILEQGKQMIDRKQNEKKEA